MLMAFGFCSVKIKESGMSLSQIDNFHSERDKNGAKSSQSFFCGVFFPIVGGSAPNVIISHLNDIKLFTIIACLFHKPMDLTVAAKPTLSRMCPVPIHQGSDPDLPTLSSSAAVFPTLDVLNCNASELAQYLLQHRFQVRCRIRNKAL